MELMGAARINELPDELSSVSRDIRLAALPRMDD
jgi:hypothetical protein